MLGSGQAQTAYALRVWTVAVARLTDRTTSGARLVGDGLDFDPHLETLLASGREGQAVAQGCSAAGWLAFVLGDEPRAVRLLGILDDHREASPGQTFLSVGGTMLAILLARQGRTLGRKERRRRERLIRELRQRATRNPEFAPHSIWLQAEIDAALGRTDAALRGLYDAAAAAKGTGHLWALALVCNRLADLHGAMQHTDLARFHIDRARTVWRRMGVVAVERQIDGMVNEDDMLDRSSSVGSFTSTDGDTLGALDVRVLLAAVRVISSEIEMDRLVERVLRVALQAAGARRGLLYLRRDDDSAGLDVVAGATVEGQAVQVLVGPPEPGTQLPDGIVAYVRRTRRHRLIDDAANDHLFAHDAYVTTRQVRSVVCVPLLSHGAVAGVLYLENDRGAGVFTDGHLGLLQAIGGQGVIAVENARLFGAQRRSAEAFGRFVPRPFLAHIGRRRIEDVQLGDSTEREVSVLFSDLRSFTAISEQFTVSGNFALINDYLARMLPAVNANGGFVDKFIGDAVMALFLDEPDGAVQAAIGMHRALELFNAERAARGEPRLDMGVGVHTGTVMLGTVGSAERMKTTVIGDAVNLASRLEGMTKHYGAALLQNPLSGGSSSGPRRIRHRRDGDPVRAVPGVRELLEHAEDRVGEQTMQLRSYDAAGDIAAST